MIRLLRFLFGVRQVIGVDRAVAIAKGECEKRRWPWVEPVAVEEGVFEYAVRTNARSRGGNVNVRVRCADGNVVGAAFARY